MKVLMIACSVAACERMYRLKEIWEEQEQDITITCMVKCAALPALSETESLTACVGKWFQRVDAIVFLCACGIAVRSIAPWLIHKSKDPAVIVMDETEKFCIPLLGGHWGGANALAEKLARMTGAALVITTATDREEKFAVDVFAKRNGLVLTDWKLAKKISALILEGETVEFYSDPETEGVLPKELRPCFEKKPEALSGKGAEPECMPEPGRHSAQTGIAVSCFSQTKQFFAETLQLIPKTVVAGVGCRRGISQEKIEAAIRQCLKEAGICPEALCAVASIDLKREEKGILSYCEEEKIEFLTFPARVLGQAEGAFTESAFVESVTGVGNVCERSAVVAAGVLSVREEEGRAPADGWNGAEPGSVLICRKRIYDGVTVALAQKKARVRF